MKKLVLILVMGILVSCSKDAETTPIVSPSPVVVMTDGKLLDVKIDTLGVDYTNIAPYQVHTLLGATDQEIGKVYYYSKDNLVCTISYEYGIGVTRFLGSHNGKGFTVNLNSSTVNVCGGPQNSKVIYKLKDPARIGYEDTFYKRKALWLLRDLKLETA